MIDIIALHFNGKEWPSPNTFIPERFDPTNDFNLTVDKKKRNPASWAPYSGGKRVCLGRAFAESTLKITAIYLSQYFDFEIVPDKNHEYYTS